MSRISSLVASASMGVLAGFGQDEAVDGCGCQTGCVTGTGDTNPTTALPITPRNQLTRANQLLMSYDFEPLVHRMMDKHGWTERKAREVFTDLKRFYCLSGQGEISPTKDIDEMWHAHILFMEEYARFCSKYRGFLIIHRPYMRGHKKGDARKSARETQRRVAEMFGESVAKSANWQFAEASSCGGPDGGTSGGCGSSDGGHCSCRVKD